MTSIYKCNGKAIRPGQQFVDADGTVHPGSWYTYSPSTKTEIGITEIIQESPPSSIFHWWSYNADGTVNATAKPLDDVNEVDEEGSPLLDEDGKQVVTLGVKSNLIGQVRAQQGSLLSQTDWALVRYVDTSVAVPANIQTWRDAIRVKATEMEAAITSAPDANAAEDLFMTYTHNTDGSTSMSGILYDWPVLLDN